MSVRDFRELNAYRQLSNRLWNSTTNNAFPSNEKFSKISDADCEAAETKSGWIFRWIWLHQ